MLVKGVGLFQDMTQKKTAIQSLQQKLAVKTINRTRCLVSSLDKAAPFVSGGGIISPGSQRGGKTGCRRRLGAGEGGYYSQWNK